MTDFDTTAFPREIHVFLTTVCNLRCAVCGQWGANGLYSVHRRQPRTRYISLELVERLVTEAEAAGARLNYYLMGGEPFLHPQIHTIAERLMASPSCAFADVNSNGTRLDDDGMRRLIACGFSGVAFSIDGPDEATNAPLRGPGVLAKTLASLRRLHELRERAGAARPTISVVSTIQAESYTRLHELLERLEQEPVENVWVQTPYYLDEAQGERSSALLERELGVRFEAWRGFVNAERFRGIDPVRLEQELARIEARPWRFRLHATPAGMSPRLRSTYFDDAAWMRTTAGFVCPKIFSRAALYPDGSVVPCTEFGDLVMGNLAESSFAEIWHGSRYRRFRELL